MLFSTYIDYVVNAVINAWVDAVRVRAIARA
jgi:hypothetical protein